MARSVDRLNKAQIKANKVVARFFSRNGGIVVRHWETEQETGLYLRGDGVHLNVVGIDMWALGFQDGIQHALRVFHAWVFLA